MGYLFLFFFFSFFFFFFFWYTHDMRRKETCSLSLSLSLSLFVIIAHPPTVYIALSISSSLHTCPLSNDRLTGASLKVVGGSCFKFFFSRNTKTKRNKNENENVWRCMRNPGPWIWEGGWTPHTYTYTALSLLTLVFLFCRHSYKSHRETPCLLTKWMTDWRW